MARLDDRFVTGQGRSLAHFFLIKTLNFAIPLLLDNFDHIALVLRLKDWKLDLDRIVTDASRGSDICFDRDLGFICERV